MAGFLSVGLLLTSFCVPAVAAPQKSKPLPEPLAALAKEVETVENEFRPRVEAAGSDDAQLDKLREARHERMRAIARKALELAADHPNEPIAIAARTWVVNGRFVGVSPETAEALRLLAEKHINDAGLGPAVEFAPIYSQIPEAMRLLRDAWTKSPHRDVRGTAGYSLAWRLQLNSVGRSAKERPQEAATNAVEAERLLEQLAKDYADVPSCRGTVGSDAKTLLFRMRNLVVGRPAPDFRCTDASGREVKLSDLKGRVVVLDFWYVACGPCRAQFPHLRKIVERHADKPFTLVGISEDEDRNVWEDFLKNEKLPWTQWYSGPKGVVGEWSITIFPTYYVIDAKGVIRFVNPRGDELDKAVDALVAEASDKKPQ
jgi:peroxiredoxin